MSLPLRLIVRIILTIGIVIAMTVYLPQYMTIGGGAPVNYIILGLIIALLNFFVRPILKILTLPLHLFFSLLAHIIVNSAILSLASQVAGKFDPSTVTLEIAGGVVGWIVVSTVIGMANWFMKSVL